MSSVLNRIMTTLGALCTSEDVPMEGVWYGACRKDELDNWNYFVFNRRTTQKASNRMDFETYYEVHVIHEDFIPEGYLQKVITALEEASDPGTKLKAASEDIEYNYIFKGKTNMVVEIATIAFVHPEKRC